MRLAEDANGVGDPDAHDANGDEGGGAAEDGDEGLDLADAADDVALTLLAVGVVTGEEKLLLLIAGELAAVGEQADEDGGERGPDD